ncbi:MAG: hypothetical protein ACUVQG_02100 [Thermogutta sp.]
MLRFDRYRRGVPLPSQREQRRLLLLVLIIGGIILTPQWIRRLGILGPTVATDNKGPGPNHAGDVTTEAATTAENSTPHASRSQDFLKQLSGIDFSSVEDNTPFRSEEKAAWFSTLQLLCEVSQDDLRPLRSPWVTFSQLYRNTPQYRGKVVAARGEFMGVAYYPAPPNDAGIQGYYQAWLRPDREQDPIVVYCLRLPSGFPQGMRIQEPVEVVGVCFKRWVYQAQDGLRAAPVILTNEPFWIPPAKPSGSAADSGPNLLLAIVISAILAAVFVGYVFRRRGSGVPRLPETS